LIVMGINRPDAANFAGFLVEFACLDGPLHSEVRFVLARVGSASVRLPDVGFQHCANALVSSLDLPVLRGGKPSRSRR
jgi:hypothetical protein